nr:MAG TPA: Cytochrome c oxidase polypeptide [Caudoviricetes sp.]
MILISAKLNNYLIMGRLVCLGGSLLIMAASFYPLLDLINSFGDVEHRVSTLTIGLILIWLVVALIFGALLFYFTWQDIIDEEEEKYD